MHWDNIDDDGVIIVKAQPTRKVHDTIRNDCLILDAQTLSDLNACELTIGQVLSLYDAHKDNKLILLLLNEVGKSTETCTIVR